MSSNIHFHTTVQPFRLPPPNQQWKPIPNRIFSSQDSPLVYIQPKFSHPFRNSPVENTLLVPQQRNANIQIANKEKRSSEDIPERNTGSTNNDHYYSPRDDYYIIPNKKRRGIGVIITDERCIGSNEDRQRLTEMFMMMRLIVCPLNNQGTRDILKYLEKWSKTGFNNTHYLLMVAFITFGDGIDTLCGSDGTLFSLINDVIPMFKLDRCTPLLEGKPKVFLVQACFVDQTDDTGIQHDVLVRKELISNDSDFLIAYKNSPQFFQKLCDGYSENRKDHTFVEILNSAGYPQHNTLRKSLWIDPCPCEVSCIQDPEDASSPFDNEDSGPLAIRPEILQTDKMDNKPWTRYYDTEGECAGLGIIIVNHKCGTDERDGSERDLENFKHIFANMNLKVVVKVDLDSYSFLQHILNTVKAHKNPKSIFIAISTHGYGIHTLCCHNGAPVAISDIVMEVKCIKDLAGIPKVFLIEACRGTAQDIRIESRSEKEQIVSDSAPKCCTLESDWLLVYSSVEGYTSRRCITNGSWFVTALRKMFDETHGNGHLLELLTATNHELIYNYHITNKFGATVTQPLEIKFNLTKLFKI